MVTTTISAIKQVISGSGLYLIFLKQTCKNAFKFQVQKVIMYEKNKGDNVRTQCVTAMTANPCTFFELHFLLKNPL